MRNFAIIGLGYVSHKHLRAIKAHEGKLLAAFEPKNPAVGVLDQYFPECEFFTDYNAFKEWIHQRVDCVIICSPSDCHYKHIIDFQDFHSAIICEKPTILDLKYLGDINDNVFTMLQLRYSEYLKDIKPVNRDGEPTYDVVYHTPRGKWYDHSWKADPKKSGGLLMNIGVHLFDLMMYKLSITEWHGIQAYNVNSRYKFGHFYLGDNRINWSLSIEEAAIPRRKINGVELKDAQELHSKAYYPIMKYQGGGIRINQVKPSLELIHEYSRISKSSQLL